MSYNKFTVLLLSLLLTSLLLTSKVNADEAIINIENLNVRSGPSTDFKLIDQIQANEVYPIIQMQDEWTEIQLTHETGWVSNEFITIQKEDNQINKSDKTMQTKTSITITQDKTHIRNGPSTEYKIISFAKIGEEFQVTSEDHTWYEVKLKDGTGYIYKGLIDRVQVKKSNNLVEKVIVIDAGHGGQDVGAIGLSGKFEKEHTLKTAFELKHKLTILGAKVIMTREDDTYIGLGSRASLSNIKSTDAFISIHYNSYPELPDITGIGTYYYNEEDKQLANFIQSKIIQRIDTNDRGIAFEDFQVLRQSLKPAILIELGFISNYNEEQLFIRSGHQQKLVTGMIEGLNEHFKN